MACCWLCLSQGWGLGAFLGIHAARPAFGCLCLGGWESMPAHPSPGSGPPLLTQCGDGSGAGEDCHPGTASLSGSSSVSCPSPAIACYWFLSFYWYGILVPGQFPLLPSPKSVGLPVPYGWVVTLLFFSQQLKAYLQLFCMRAAFRQALEALPFRQGSLRACSPWHPILPHLWAPAGGPGQRAWEWT